MQADFFAETSIAELQELAADLDDRGQQEPVQCLPGGTIIGGHRRVAAAKLLGWEQIRVVIREDLGEVDSPAVINHLIADNVMRRQLDDLSLARCYRGLKEIASEDTEKSGDNGDLRDQLAARLGCDKSGRTMDRLVRLLDLPLPLQDAITRGELTKDQGAKILKLPKAQQNEIAHHIEQGDTLKRVLCTHGVIEAPQAKSKTDIARELLHALKTNVGKLSGDVEDYDKIQVRGNDAIQVLDDAIDFLTRWRNRKASLRERSRDMIFDRVGDVMDKLTSDGQ